MQLRISTAARVPHESLADAGTLPLRRPIAGDTLAADDDYRSSSACFTGPGNDDTEDAEGLTSSTASLPPAPTRTPSTCGAPAISPVLYVADTLPGGTPPGIVSAPCVGADRASRAETVKRELAAGQEVFVVVDSSSYGGTFRLDAARAVGESEPNDTLETSGPPRCGALGSLVGETPPTSSTSVRCRRTRASSRWSTPLRPPTRAPSCA